MIVNFQKEVYQAVERREQREVITFKEYMEFTKSFSAQDAAKAAYHLNRFVWDTDLLGGYPGVKRARAITDAFLDFASQYEIFKYECLVIKGMTEDETREAVTENIFNNIFQLIQRR